MGSSNILDWIRDKIGCVAWKVFLWSIRMTEEKYLDAIWKQEKAFREEKGGTV